MADMNETRHQTEASSPSENPRSKVWRRLLWGITILVLLAAALLGVFHWRRSPTTVTNDPYAKVPFRPRVTYDSLNVSVTNTEGEPYLDTSLNLYVGALLYSVRVGTIRPGETITCSLRSFKNERGESFDPNTTKTSELEVRARFAGYDVHKDFPAPP